MHCPKCGQEQITEETRFCSRCGFLLTGVAEVIANQGLIPGTSLNVAKNASSPRKRGLKMGLFIFLLSFLVIPIISVITIALNIRPFGATIAAVLLIVGGLLRMVYALMFESNIPGDTTLEQKLLAPSESKKWAQPQALPPQQSIPVQAYQSPAAGAWRDTNDLEVPVSVTDNTTKLLKNEADTQ